MNNITIPINELSHWFNAIRAIEPNNLQKTLDAFSIDQLKSKLWLIDQLKSLVVPKTNIYIFGGWIGLLANIIFINYGDNISSIISVDLDSECEKIANSINCNYLNDQQFNAVTTDMKDFAYDWNKYPQIVINTSTEHINQETYDLWYDQIPNNTITVVQGNNFFNCSDHIRCSESLLEFKQMNHVSKTLFEGQLECSSYTRYMCIFHK
jgi:hypothetical protein